MGASRHRRHGVEPAAPLRAEDGLRLRRTAARRARQLTRLSERAPPPGAPGGRARSALALRCRVKAPGDDLLEQRLELVVAVEARLELARASAAVASATTSLRRLRRRARRACPRPRCERDGRRARLEHRRRPRRASPRSSALARASAPAGASASTPRMSRTIASARGWSALLTTITSGISITPAFSACTESPEPGDQHEHDAVGVVDDVDLRLTDADRLEVDLVAAGGVHQQRRLQRRRGDAAERAARRHRADEDAARRGSARRGGCGRRAPRRRVNGEEGSIESTATRLPAARRRPTSAPSSVDLPAPGGPVMPTIEARPVCG